MIAGSLVRLSYAMGLLLAPAAMGRARLAARTSGNADATMTTRAFGAVHVNVSLLSLRAAVDERNLALALGLNVGCELGDLIATMLEWRDGDLSVGSLVSSAVLQTTGVATWSTILRALSPTAR